VVDNVTFESSEVKDSQNGIRIKTISGDTGSVTSVTYKSITLSGITEYGVTVRQGKRTLLSPLPPLLMPCPYSTIILQYPTNKTQDYNDSGNPTTGVPITKFILDNISGTVDSSGYNYYIVCGAGSCSDWTWTNVDVTGGKTSTGCENLPSGISC